MSQQEAGFVAALRDVIGAFAPRVVREMEAEIDARLSRVPSNLGEYGFDPFGLSPDWLRRTALPAALMYRYYFRTDVHDIDRVPQGRCLLVANHAGQLPFDGMMLSSALLLDAEPPRIARPMAEYWVSELPWVSVIAARTGTLVGTPRNCTSMLEAGECVMVFPEGVRGMNKLFSQRYKLQRFGTGFLRLALETRTPIVPVSIVGSEEQQPGLANLRRLGRFLGMPALPITPTFPLLGPLGLLPLPVRYHIYFGEPFMPRGEATDDDAHIEEQVDVVRTAIEAGLQRGLKERRGVFR